MKSSGTCRKSYCVFLSSDVLDHRKRVKRDLMPGYVQKIFRSVYAFVCTPTYQVSLVQFKDPLSQNMFAQRADSDQTARMRRLILALHVRTCLEDTFSRKRK